MSLSIRPHVIYYLDLFTKNTDRQWGYWLTYKNTGCHCDSKAMTSQTILIFMYLHKTLTSTLMVMLSIFWQLAEYISSNFLITQSVIFRVFTEVRPRSPTPNPLCYDRVGYSDENPELENMKRWQPIFRNLITSTSCGENGVIRGMQDRPTHFTSYRR